MWKILETSTPLYVKFNQEDLFEVLITDFVNLWSTTFTRSDFINCLKKSNSNFQFTDEEKLMQRGINMFAIPEQLESNVQLNDDKSMMSITLTTSISDFNFNLDCKLMKQSEIYYFKHVTQPLLRTIKDLRTSENKLTNMLIDKDKEIRKYQVQNVDILYSGKTDLFDSEAHSINHNLYEQNFGTSDTLDVILEKVIKTPEKVLVKLERETEEMDIKTEPETSTDDQSIHVKKEKEPIKTEPNVNVSSPIKRKKWLNY